MQAKRQAQDHLLLDEDDPTLNNPALDLEDSDADDEWTPIKEKVITRGVCFPEKSSPPSVVPQQYEKE